MAGATTIEPGLHCIEAGAYHADPAPEPSLSSSIARLLLNKSPRHAWVASPRLNPDWEPVEKKHFDVGRAAHRVVLGAGEDYLEIPTSYLSKSGATSTTAAREFIEEARAMGRTPLKPEDHEAVQEMALEVRKRLRAMGIAFEGGRSELTALARIDGAWCRAMVDSAPTDPRLPLYDLKTTTDATPNAVIRTIENNGYDVQAAHYIDCWEAATGERRKMRFVFVEKDPPHEVQVVELHDDPDDEADWMLDAHSKAAEARRMWRECLEADEWPGYPERVAIVGARPFFRERWAARPIGAPVIAPKPDAETVARATELQAP